MSDSAAERVTECLGLAITSRVWRHPEAGAVSAQAITIVALHGWQDNAASFDALGQVLTRSAAHGYALHALDLPGHGRSAHFPPSQFYNLWDYGAVVQAYIEQIDGPVWLCGHSLGGMVATLLTAARPDRIAGLITLDMLGLATDPPEQQISRVLTTLQDQRQPARASQPSPSLAHAVARRQRIGSPQTQAANTALVRRGATEQGGRWHFNLDPRVRFGSVLRFTEPQVVQLCAGIERPWSVILGTEGLYSRTFADRIQSVLPKVRIQWWPGGHHFHMESSPDDLWRCLMECLSPAHNNDHKG